MIYKAPKSFSHFEAREVVVNSITLQEACYYLSLTISREVCIMWMYGCLNEPVV